MRVPHILPDTRNNFLDIKNTSLVNRVIDIIISRYFIIVYIISGKIGIHQISELDIQLIIIKNYVGINDKNALLLYKIYIWKIKV